MTNKKTDHDDSAGRSKRAEEALRESEERFRLAAENASDLIWEWDIVNGKLEWFGAIDALLGYAPGEFPRTIEAWERIIYMDDRNRVMAALDRHLKTQSPYREEYRVRCIDGTMRSWTDKGTAVRNGQGHPFKMIGVCTDITERKRMEAELIKREAFNFALFEYNPIQTIVVNLEGKVIKFNLAKKKSGDRLPHIGDTMFKDYAGKHKIDMYAELMKCIRSGEEKEFPELKYGDRVLATTISPFPKGAVIISEDITERKRAEASLEQALNWQQMIFEGSRDAIFISDQDSRFVEVNNSACDLTGYSREQLLQMRIPDIHDLPDLDAYKLYHQRIFAGEEILSEAKILRSDGVKIDTEFSNRCVSIAGKPYMHTTARNITERKRAEEALRVSEAKYRQLIESLNEGVWMIDEKAVTTFINPRMAEMLGYTVEEMSGRSLFSFMDEQGVQLATRKFACRRQGLKEQHDFEFLRKDGTRIHTSLGTAPLIDLDGNFRGAIAGVTDITDRKRMEAAVRRKSKELQEKNEELARFIYSVSHDLRSPLVTIQTFQEYLERDAKSQDAARVEKDLGYIRNAADKMGRLLDDIRRFSRVGRITNPSEEATLQAIGQEALDLAAGRIAGRGVRVQVTEEPVVLYGDRARLVEIFLNLVENAVKFMGDQPAPHIEIGVEQAGDEAVLFVRDNGIGIDPELQPLVFDLFHKLNPGSEGEGLGLALVKRIVELHGGRIWLESEGLGKGAMFRFTLAKTRREVGRVTPRGDDK